MRAGAAMMLMLEVVSGIVLAYFVIDFIRCKEQKRKAEKRAWARKTTEAEHEKELAAARQGLAEAEYALLVPAVRGLAEAMAQRTNIPPDQAERWLWWETDSPQEMWAELKRPIAEREKKERSA